MWGGWIFLHIISMLFWLILWLDIQYWREISWWWGIWRFKGFKKPIKKTECKQCHGYYYKSSWLETYGEQKMEAYENMCIWKPEIWFMKTNIPILYLKSKFLLGHHQTRYFQVFLFIQRWMLKRQSWKLLLYIQLFVPYLSHLKMQENICSL